MTLLTKDSSKKHSQGNALLIGAQARAAKEKDNHIIDSTIGMLFDEKGNFLTFKSVEDVSMKLSGKEKYSYGATPGSKEFAQAILEWVFKDHLSSLEKEVELRVIATPGGTGAICNTLSNYLEEGQKVLLPNYMWTNYIQIAREEHCDYTTYNMFNKNGEFDTEDFLLKCIQMKNEQGRVFVIINDPCHNPTGYTMSYIEWISIIQALNTVSRDGTPVILLYDMAYIDYDKRGFEASRNNIALFSTLNESVLTVLAFSGSKTMGLYGLRIGAQIAMTKTKEVADDFYSVCDFSARGKWSGSSTLGQNIITKVLTDYKEQFSEELAYARKLLIDRADCFIEESKRVGLQSLPYSCGFFVAIPCDNPQKVFEELKEKGLYVLPIQHAIRLTLSSISIEEVKRAVSIIKDTI